MSAETHNDQRAVVTPGALLIGIGNSGRSDDGLGWAFLDRIQQETGFDGETEYRYQLQVEDAAMISRAERVIFVDSYKGNLPGGFAWKPCEASGDFEFTSHVLSASAVMYLCQDLFGKTPRADLLLIQGTSWDLKTGMTPEAGVRLDKALQFFNDRVQT